MTVAQLGLAGWLVGLLAYLAALLILHGQWISGGDFRAVALSSLIGFGLCYSLVYLPVLRAVQRRFPPPQSVWLFPVVAVLLGVLPTALIARFWGGSLRALLSPEAVLFLILFTVVGVVVGLGFTRLKPSQ